MMENFDDRNDIELTKVPLDDLANILSAIANKSRLQLIEALFEGPKEFSELKEVVKLSKTALAHHLEKLVQFGIIKNVGRGKYKINDDGKELFITVKDVYLNLEVRKKMNAKRKADHIQQMYSSRHKDELKFEFIRLLPMRVISFHAVSDTPENDAWIKLRSWAEPRGYFEDLDNHPIYGFNNPNPRLGEKVYGYEFWLVVEPDYETDDVTVKDVPESFNVVTRCHVEDPMKDIPKAWGKLLDWIKTNNVKFAGKCGLEKIIDSSHSSGEFILDIYIPIVESSIPRNLK